MLKRLEVRNFRSLHDAKIDFAPSGLTVVVGANASGKSNLIKCLEFLSAVPREGLEGAFRMHRGVEAIVPKALRSSSFRNTEIQFAYSLDLPRYSTYPATAPPLNVKHSLTLLVVNTRSAIMKEESLEFAEPLLVQYFLRAGADNQQASESVRQEALRTLAGSAITIRRNGSGQVEVRTDPPTNDENTSDYLEWFGLSFLKEGFKSAQSVEHAIAQLLSGTRPDIQRPLVRAGTVSLLERESLLVALCAEARALANFLSTGIKRYDLQLAELRKEQDISASKELMPDGRGMPATVRRVRSSSSEQDSWSRIRATLEILAPQITDTTTSQLKTGHEFVRFIERRTGRAVESWQASDGTLRALAILLAVETQPQSGVILIEEPEQGLHPWAVRTLISHIRETIVQRGIQVVLTTHSQQVLDSVEPSEIVIATRSAESGTKFRAIEEIFEKSQLEKGEIGRIWVSGLLGGVPSPEVL